MYNALKNIELLYVIGAITAFFAATTGVVQNDIKKVIAYSYSTCSQLGYITRSIYPKASHTPTTTIAFTTFGLILLRVTSRIRQVMHTYWMWMFRDKRDLLTSPCGKC
jgi:formate hydrogenlyase subunit 3/multisubunit Na+/H+ antiporter MnhD subunit